MSLRTYGSSNWRRMWNPYEIKERKIIKLMANDAIKMDGTVKEVVNANSYKVLLQNGIEVMASVSGKMRMHKIQILPGDIVQVELSPYDLTRGRITYRR